MTDLSRRNKANKRKGSQWQSDLETFLRAEGHDIEQLHLQGAEDEGDHVVRGRATLPLPPAFLVVEAKNEKSIDLAGYVREMEDEVANFRKHRPHLHPAEVDGVVIIKRRNHGIRKAYVVTTLERYFGLEEAE